jgi:heme exporter protein A
MTDRAIAIEATGLGKSFGGRAVLTGIDFQVHEGRCVALTGANGAGKTTLLRLLAALVRPTAGEVRWFGRPAARLPADRRLVGVLAHESLLYPHLTVRENLLFAARMCDVPRPARRVDPLLESVGLRPHSHRPTSQISKGMRQRLAVLRALVHDPPILLLDEPFSGLDEEGADWLARLLPELRGRGRAVCFSTHDRPMAHRLADRLVHLESGRIRQVEARPGDAAAQPPAVARAA